MPNSTTFWDAAPGARASADRRSESGLMALVWGKSLAQGLAAGIPVIHVAFGRVGVRSGTSAFAPVLAGPDGHRVDDVNFRSSNESRRQAASAAVGEARHFEQPTHVSSHVSSAPPAPWRPLEAGQGLDPFKAVCSTPSCTKTLRCPTWFLATKHDLRWLGCSLTACDPVLRCNLVLLVGGGTCLCLRLRLHHGFPRLLVGAAASRT
jgi:hypothetical protein